MTSTHLVYVYGTLKTGEANHSKMTDETNGRAEFIGVGTTVVQYPLVIGTRYNVPFLLAQKGIGKNVEGEVYRVDDEKLKALDTLEEHPRFYERRLEQVLLTSGDSVAAWIYFLPVWRDDLIASEHFVSYSSNGSHGRKLASKASIAQGMKDEDLRILKNRLIAEVRGESQ